ncbi:hypothetical protein BDV95DRAFT_639967 [Massariosphaeria phaeospora]|uniref:F-box domain-containing protein n=1 Tax=Massariosphaeria phaeospora TaxID=100035 RepID=A0A7C8I974_9PLEO|nr:hypothetical protein BDV95DRAFT_639967 [Massariosphaeria phaeospora]
MITTIQSGPSPDRHGTFEDQKGVQADGSNKGALAKDDTTAVTGFLALPAEIRNYIYELATEKPIVDEIAPCLAPKTSLKHWRASPASLWDYFALTQVCQQIRAEYRPCWIRQWCVRVRWEFFKRFMDTFISPHHFDAATPKLIQLSFVYEDMYTRKIFDITELLRLRTANPTFKFEFIAHRLSYGIHDEGYCCKCGSLLSEFAGDGDKECGSGSCSGTAERMKASIRSWHSYLDVFNGILAMDNAKWLRAIREDHIDAVAFQFADCKLQLDISFRLGEAPAEIEISPRRGAARWFREVGLAHMCMATFSPCDDCNDMHFSIDYYAHAMRNSEVDDYQIHEFRPTDLHLWSDI